MTEDRLKTMEKDPNGFATACNFLKTSGRRPTCTALVDFYNSADLRDQCGLCPFFKTHDEFQAGWRRRAPDIEVDF